MNNIFNINWLFGLFLTKSNMVADLLMVLFLCFFGIGILQTLTR
ncbi:hypothetical protein ykris0001_33040 [Yersinia kristensenii ATCC 33638]|nr:hypothetical protein ykris0001_33040 [Yersinia kristensenii ATCC 33638]